MADAPVAGHHHHAGFGEPDIGVIGSMFLVTNNIIVRSRARARSSRALFATHRERSSSRAPRGAARRRMQPRASSRLPAREPHRPPHCRRAPPPPPPPLQGPACLQLPGVFQISGWIPALATLAVCAVWTTFASGLMVRAMQLFRGNKAFSKRLEFGKLAFYLLPRWLYYIAVGSLVFVFFTQNLANILVTAQTMDNMIIASVGKTCAVVLDASASKHFLCIADADKDGSSDSPFGQATVFSLGYAITLLLAIPLGILNLDDNIGIQIAGMLLTFVCVGVWVLNFCAIGLKSSLLPAFAPASDTGYLLLLPAILFNYGFVNTIPSWINEKRKDVRVDVTLWGAQGLASVQYVLIAVFGGLAIDFSDGVDITARMNDPKQHGVWLASRIMTFVFPLANILTSIPVFSIIIRYNLLQLEGVRMPVWFANAVAVFAPWVVAVPLYSGNQVNTLITWSSAILFTLMNLLLPVLMYISAERMAAAGSPPVMTDAEWDDDAPEEGLELTERGGGYEPAASSASLEDDEAALGGGSGSVPLLATPTKAGARPAAAAAAAAGEHSGGDAKQSILSLLSNPAALRLKLMAGHGSDAVPLYEAELEEVHALPGWCRRNATGCGSELLFGQALLALSVATAITAIVLQVWSSIYQPASGSGGGSR